jgi:hypothetical protein
LGDIPGSPLLEPLVGAYALIWSTLDSPASAPAVEAPSSRGEWSPVDRDGWFAAVAAELIRLGHPAPRLPPDADDVAHLLACARAASLRSPDGARLVAASIVRMSGWPGATDIIDPIAARAVDCALEHMDDVDPETDNDALVDTVQDLLFARRRGLARLGARPVIRCPSRSCRLRSNGC